jgi:hypothetical protein
MNAKDQKIIEKLDRIEQLALEGKRILAGEKQP